VAVAAYKLWRPVRISLDRNTDMQMIGGKSPTKASYRVSFTKSGKITALKAHILLEAGWFSDIASYLPLVMNVSLKKYNWGTFDVKYTVCKTNNVPKTSVRGPGDCEGSTIVDTIANHVASYLGISGNKVRDENLHTPESIRLFQGEAAVAEDNGFTLPTIWERAKSWSKLEEREKEIERFNEQSRWLKRGILIVPSVYGVSVSPNAAIVSIFQDGSIVVEVGGVEMGQGLYTKVRQAVTKYVKRNYLMMLSLTSKLAYDISTH
jgi:xanthine dehydrogenase molybdopterin-binding subunit B